jgi:cystathionine beta-lyase/cystathionine gamma-synthase
MSRAEPAPNEGKARRRFDELPEWAGIATRLARGAQRPELNAGSVVPPVYQTSTFHYPESVSESARGGGDLYLYTRHENPTQEVAAELIRSAEGAEAARVFGSGMGAMATTLLALLRSGDEVVALDSLYGGTLDLLSDFLPRFGVRVRWVDAEGAREPEKVLSKTTRVVVVESPTNPTLRVLDLRRWAEATDRVGAISVIDNTFATPVAQRPIELGFDLVMHSASKYLGGHSDLIAGAVAGPRALMDRVRANHVVLGSVLDPFAAFLLARGLRTLPLRFTRQSRTAEQVVAALAKHPRVTVVNYPGRASAEEEAIAARQMSLRGGVLSFAVRGGDAAARALLPRLRLVHPAASLGGVESLASCPRETSHPHLSDEERTRRGIVPGLVRLSVGLEEPEDLIRDLREALDGLP